LLNSWVYYRDCDAAYQDSVKQSFLNSLKKIPFEPTEAMKKGIQFEKDVYDFCDGFRPGVITNYWECVEEVSRHIKGGVRQIVVQKDINVCKMDFLLYGKMDALKGPIGYDIKFTENYEYPKYKETSQHVIYLGCLTDTPVFRYLISNEREVYTEDYLKQNSPSCEFFVYQFISFIKNWPEAWEIFLANWKTKY
jgi:hypothetical protein